MITDTAPYPQSPSGPKYWRSLFVSDLHMGTPRFDAAAFLHFLQATESEYLYLVGDILDGWKLAKEWYWPATYDQIFQELLRKQENGTKVILIAGNHDEALRNLTFPVRHAFTRAFGVPIIDTLIHHTADGRRCLILHGDQFDRAIIRGSLAKLSDRVYDWFMQTFRLSRGAYIHIDGRWRRFSLSKAVRRSGQWALYLINNFENAVRRRARSGLAQILICGHSHLPKLKDLDGITYGNCGCWVSGKNTFLAESETGEFSLETWTLPAPSVVTPKTTTSSVFLAPDMTRYFAKARKLHDLVARIWHPSLAETRKTLFNDKPGDPDFLYHRLTELLSPHTVDVGSVALAQVPVQTQNPDIRVVDEIGWDGFQIVFEPPFGFKFLPKPGLKESLAETQRDTAGNIDTAARPDQ